VHRIVLAAKHRRWESNYIYPEVCYKYPAGTYLPLKNSPSSREMVLTLSDKWFLGPTQVRIYPNWLKHLISYRIVRSVQLLLHSLYQCVHCPTDRSRYDSNSPHYVVRAMYFLNNIKGKYRSRGSPKDCKLYFVKTQSQIRLTNRGIHYSLCAVLFIFLR